MGNKNVCICLIRATFSLSLWFGRISCQLQSFGISTNHLENKRVSACCHCGAEFAAQFLCLQRHYYFICRPARLYIFFLSFFLGFKLCRHLFAVCSLQFLTSWAIDALAWSHTLASALFLAPLLILERLFVIICCSSKQKAAMWPVYNRRVQKDGGLSRSVRSILQWLV